MYQGIAYDIAAVMTDVKASGLLGSLCTIREPSGNQTASGAPDGTYVDVAGMVNIPCRCAPVSAARISATEVKTLTEILSSNISHVLLDGYYPSLSERTDRVAVIDNVTYDILGAESDSDAQMTRMGVRIASL